MKVSGTSGAGSAGGPKSARGAGGGDGFRISFPTPAAGPSAMSSASAMNGVMGVEALLALQDVGGPLERKRRAVSRADRILDVLDGVKVAFLDGQGPSAHDLERLRRAVRDQREHTDDPRLESVLDDVELRAAVEIAKLEQARRAA